MDFKALADLITEKYKSLECEVTENGITIEGEETFIVLKFTEYSPNRYIVGDDIDGKIICWVNSNTTAQMIMDGLESLRYFDLA